MGLDDIDCSIGASCAILFEDGTSQDHAGDGSLDWMLTNHDAKSSEPQSLEEELRRLQVLRSYLILDSEREYPFERLTAFASRILDVPIALVSLGKSLFIGLLCWLP